MKKIIALISAAVLCMNMIAGAAFAAGSTDEKEPVGANTKGYSSTIFSGETLKKLIKLVESKLNIPAGYEDFSSSVENYNNKDICRLNWSSADLNTSRDGGSIDVTIDKMGNILHYNHYRYSRNTDYQRRLPAVTKAAALENARRFCLMICPDIAEELTINANSYIIDYDGTQEFEFFRQHEGIPFYENSVNVAVDGRTGEIMSFERNWNNDIRFSDPVGVISLAEAEKQYIKSSSLELKYRKFYNDEGETYLEYSPRGQYSDFAIDAVNGEKVEVSSRYTLYADAYYKYEIYRREEINRGAALNADEVDELLHTGTILPLDKAEKKIKNIPELGIGSKHSLNHYSYSRIGDKNKTFLLKLEYSSPMTKEDLGKGISEEKAKTILAMYAMPYNTIITLNARTLEVIEVATYNSSYFDGSNAAYPKEKLKTTAESFLKNHKLKKFKQVFCADNPVRADEFMMKKGGEPIGEGTFYYIRKVNGTSFEDNTITIEVDPLTGHIRNYYEYWDDDLDFVLADDAISLEKAYEVLFKANPLELKYMNEQSQEGMAPGTLSNRLKLVYAVDFKKPVCVDARKGILIDYFNAVPYKEKGKVQFDDISGHKSAKQIQALAEIGLFQEDKSFRPDDAVLQKELLYMIAQMKTDYYYSSKIGSGNQQEQDSMYRLLINDCTIDEEERDPDSELSREQAVMFMLRAIGYRKFAELPDLFKCRYSDSDSITPELMGYVAIAASMKIMRPDGAFDPQRPMTRAEAAEMIYNYLAR